MADIAIINENELRKIFKEETLSVFDNYSYLFNKSNELSVINITNLIFVIAFLKVNS